LVLVLDDPDKIQRGKKTLKFKIEKKKTLLCVLAILNNGLYRAPAK